MTLLILFFVLSIAFSFLCSIMEAVLLSITPSYVKRKQQEGSTTGMLLEEYKKDIDKPLSAILTLNTIAHTAGAIGVGAQAGALFGENSFSVLGVPFSFETIIAVIMTLAILILSEIIPKTIGANRWRELAPITVKALQFIMFILTPFVWISQFITKNLKKEKNESVLTRNDFSLMAKAGYESGTLAQKESTIINNVLDLERRNVREVMTPRTVLIMADDTQKVSAFYEARKGSLPYSRIPLYNDQADNLTGLALKDDILKALADDKPDMLLSELKRELLTVQEDQTLFQTFELLTRRRSHIAAVTDNYGSLVGVVTLEDVVETLFGMEIMDETDKVPDLQDQARQLWESRKQKPRKP